MRESFDFCSLTLGRIHRAEPTALQQVTGRLADIAGHLETVATQLDAIGQRKARKPKDDKATVAESGEPVAKAA